MIFELLITRRAQFDLDEIFIWYEEQQPGLGDRFLNAFEDAIIKIKETHITLLILQVRQKAHS